MKGGMILISHMYILLLLICVLCLTKICDPKVAETFSCGQGWRRLNWDPQKACGFYPNVCEWRTHEIGLHLGLSAAAAVSFRPMKVSSPLHETKKNGMTHFLGQLARTFCLSGRFLRVVNNMVTHSSHN